MFTANQREALRPALAGLRATSPPSKPAKHRFFVFLDASILPDNKLVNIALDDAYFLGVLSSRIHVTWALAAGSHLGVGNDPVYVKTACFEKFPFPAATDAQQARIRGLAEQLDAHRKRQQAQHPKLTLTDMYNVLEKLRAGEPLTAKDKTVHEQGLVSVLRATPRRAGRGRVRRVRLAGRRSPTRRSWRGWSPSTPSAPPRKRRVSSAGCGPSTRRPPITLHVSRSTP